MNASLNMDPKRSKRPSYLEDTTKHQNPCAKTHTRTLAHSSARSPLLLQLLHTPHLAPVETI